MTATRNPKIALLMRQFMSRVQQVADQEDLQESDGWVGRILLKDPKGEQAYVYRIDKGRMEETDAEGPFVATIVMSQDTFLDMIDAAFDGRGEEVFRRKYGGRHIWYDGEHWLVDSERFSKVFRNMSAVKVRR